MYIVDFFRRVTRRSNIPVLIYLVLNVFVIAGIIALLFGSTGKMPFWLALIVGILVYGVSLVIALSPFGEWILRLQTGCRKITDQAVLDYMMPLFNEVYSRALRIDPALPRDIQLFMNDDESPNAFATGRKTVCITRGLLQMPPEQIKATLAHEFGHLQCGHVSFGPFIHGTFEQEHQANEFAHYLLHPSAKHFVHTWIYEHKLLTIIIGIVLLLCIASIPVTQYVQSKKYHDYYYVTDGGEHYHLEGCYYIQGKDAHRMTEEEFDSGKYTPCKICFH